MKIDDHVTGDRAISGGPIEKDPVRVLIVHLEKESRGNARGDPTAHRRMGVIGIAKIDIDQRLKDHCRRSRSGFCRACLRSRTSSRKLNPARSHIRYLHWRGFFWKKPPAMMFN